MATSSDSTGYTMNGYFTIRDNTLVSYLEAPGVAQDFVPDGVTTIGRRAFWDCCLSHVIIPDSVRRIENDAFGLCDYLEDIVIPKSVTFIGESLFEHCYLLREIRVDEGNPNYHSVDGVLFSKDLSVLYAYPGGMLQEDYAIPASVKQIANGAFCGCIGLKRITIPEGVTIIGARAFSGCKNLSDLSLPETVTYIGAFAFDWCENPSRLFIPENVASIGEHAFHSCNNLREILVDKHNTVFRTVESVLRGSYKET